MASTIDLPRIKVCGVRRFADVEGALQLGLGAVGFVDHEDSVRHVESADIRATVRKLPKPVLSVIVMVDATRRHADSMLFSTGARAVQLCGMERAVEWLRSIGDRLAVLQCVSSYPTASNEAELGGIMKLCEVFPGLRVGYSDHTPDEITGLDAANCGATILEKHFTYSRNATGPDHAASLEPIGFSNYVNNAKVGRALPGMMTADMPIELRQAMKYIEEPPPGVKPIKRVLPIEQDVRTVSRQSLTTTRDLPAGHVLARADLTIKRPGTGTPPFELEATLGKRLARAIGADMPLEARDLR